MTGCNSRNRYKWIYDQMLCRIKNGDCPVDSRLPSIHETAREFGASYVTVHRAYRLLASKGILSIGRGRSAIVVRDRPAELSSNRLIAGFFRSIRPRNMLDNFALEMYESVCDALSKHRVGLVHYREHTTGICDSISADIDEGRMSGVILDEVVPDEICSYLVKIPCPKVMYNRHPSSEIDSVAPDSEWMAEQLVARIIDSGYQRVVLCKMWQPEHHATEEGQTRLESAMVYPRMVKQILLRRGMAEKDILTLYEAFKNDKDLWKDEEWLKKLISETVASVGKKRTAFVAAHDATALSVRETLSHLGKNMHGQFGIVGKIHTNSNRASSHPVSTWLIDPAEIGSKAVEMYFERLSFPTRELRRHYLKPKFIDNGTF